MLDLLHIKRIIILITLLMLAELASSQDTVVIYKERDQAFKHVKYSGRVGVFIADMKSDISVSSEKIGAGITINVEDILGLQTNNTVLRANFKYAISKNYKHSVLFGYFGFFRKAKKVFEREVEFGDVIYPIGTQMSSRFDMQIFKLLYGYSFFKDKRIDLGISAGFYIMPISFELHAFGFKNQTSDFVAPLPLIGLYSSFSITPKFHITQSLELLYFNAFNMKGGITNLDIGLEYKPLKHIGVGISVNSFQVDFSVLELKESVLDFQGTVRTGFVGFVFYGLVYF